MTVKENGNESVSSSDKAAVLGTLFDKGVITAKQYVSRLPEALIGDRRELLKQIKEEKDEN